MNKTHYEEMLYGGHFPLQEYFELLKKELPVEGFDWEKFVATEAISDLPKIMDTQGYPPQDISLPISYSINIRTILGPAVPMKSLVG